MHSSIAPVIAGDSLLNSNTAPAPHRRGRPTEHGSRALSAAERMRLMRLRRTVKRGVKSKRVRWQHLTEEKQYELQLRHQRERDKRHRQFEEASIKAAIESGEMLPSNDDWGATLVDAPSGKGYPLSINDEEALEALNHASQTNGRKVRPAGRGPIGKKAEASEGEDDVFVTRHVRDDSRLSCYVSGCKRLVWGVRVVEGEEKFCCDLHQVVGNFVTLKPKSDNAGAFGLLRF
jgi:hypothetical protein